MTALTTIPGPPSWSEPTYNARRVYIRCMSDKALTLAGQDAFWEKTGLGYAKDLSKGIIRRMWQVEGTFSEIIISR